MDRTLPIGEEHQRELTNDTVYFGSIDRQSLGYAATNIHGGSETFGDGQHALVRVDGNNRPTRTHTIQCRTRDYTRARSDIQQAIAIACGYRVEHRLDKLPEERRYKELLVYVRGRRRDLTHGGIG